MMNDEDELHDEAEEIRKETAEEAPELAEHDRFAELEKALEEANSKALYAAAETQNVRRRLEAGEGPGGGLCVGGLRPRHAGDQGPSRPRAGGGVRRAARRQGRRATSSPGSRRPRASSTRCSPATASPGSRPNGEKLDPHKHQAMIEIPTDEAEPGTIVEEMQAGYMLKDRLLRPALVGVAQAPATSGLRACGSRPWWRG